MDLELIPVQVKGHVGDDVCNSCQVSRMNRWVDSVAGEFLEFCQENDAATVIHDFKTDRWSVSLQGKKLVKHIDECINHHIHGKDLIRYYVSSGKMERGVFDLIHWRAMDLATLRIPLRERIWTTKLSCGFCAVGSMMKKRRMWKTAACKLCSCNKENTTHLFLCPSTYNERSENF